MKQVDKQTTLKSIWYGKIMSDEVARKIIEQSSIFFIFLAIIEIVAGIVLGVDIILSGTIYLILALFLKKTNSRVVAAILLIISLCGFLFMIVNKFNNVDGSQNIILSLTTIFVSVRVLGATLCHYKFKDKKI